MSTPTRVDFPSPGGVTVAAYRWDPDGEPRAVARITHGMGEHALRYQPLADALTGRGYVVYAHDHRGHGATMTGTPGLVGADGWAELVNDLGRLGEVAHQAFPGLEHALIAHSMGSFAAQQYLLDHSDDVDAVVLTGTATLDLLEPALDLDSPLELAMFNAPFAPARTEFDWLSRDEEQVDLYVADPLCGFGLDPAGAKQMFLAARRAGDPEALAAIRDALPVLIAVGDMDPVNGQLALAQPLVDRYRSAGLTDVTFQVYPGARHEILNETNRDEVVGDILAWLEQRI